METTVVLSYTSILRMFRKFVLPLVKVSRGVIKCYGMLIYSQVGV